MRILVTRPLIQGESTAQKLMRLGHEPVLLPLANAVHMPEAARLALLQPHCGLVVTSSEALRCLKSLAPLPEHELEKPLFAIGMATAIAARDAGFNHVVASSTDGAQLAETIRDYYHDNRANHPLLYLAGIPRAARFESAITAFGIDLVVADIYQMIRLEPSMDHLEQDILDRKIDIVLLYSKETARAFVALVGPTHPSLENALFLCLSRSIGDVLPKTWRKRMIVAARPDEEALLDLL